MESCFWSPDALQHLREMSIKYIFKYGKHIIYKSKWWPFVGSPPAATSVTPLNIFWFLRSSLSYSAQHQMYQTDAFNTTLHLSSWSLQRCRTACNHATWFTAPVHSNKCGFQPARSSLVPDVTCWAQTNCCSKTLPPRRNLTSVTFSSKILF